MNVQGADVHLKVKGLFVLALFATPIGFVLEGVAQWYELNIAYVLFVFGAVVIDHVLGSCVHAFIFRDFSIKQNLKGLLIKSSLVVVVYFLGMGIVNIVGEENVVTAYFNVVLRLMVFLYPATSALKNCSIVTKGKFPPVGLMSRLNKFGSNLNLSELGEKNEKKGV